MLPELGQFALILALMLSLVQFVLPILGAHTGNRALMAVARPAAAGQFVFVAFAFGTLTWAFLSQDFSVAYVAQNSNLVLPWYYRLSAVWGAHEGSLLLWILILNIWTIAVAVLSRRLPEDFMSRVLGVLGFVSVGFLLFAVVASNPFVRHLPALADGNDLNPVLQDIGMIMHPPMLYMGFVGFSVVFAFAIAALLGSKLDQQWVRWSRPWTNAAWGVLTLGIALGSWWAYYELGWGGWWFWDPVENASFMPWLVGTALIHSQAVTEKRGSFGIWTLLLAIFAFSLSLLGTFLVRSGVVTSVHSFASDPARGLFILAFLTITVGGSLLIFALRAPRVAGGEPFAGASRETMLLINNLLFTSAAAMVLVGVLYPLFAEAFDLGRISVGPPYFGVMFLLLMAPVVLLIPFGPLLKWRQGNFAAALRMLRPALIGAVIAGVAAWLIADSMPWKGVAGIAAAIWVGLGIVSYALMRWRNAPAGRRYTPEMLGMILAHFGFAVFLCGVLVTEGTSIEKDVRLGKDETATLGAYTFRFDGVEHVEGPNFKADQGTITVTKNDAVVAVMHPQKRQYTKTSQIQTESDIDPGFTRDLYVALGEPLGDSGAWSVRVYLKPFVRWIWLGALLMMLGGFVAAADRRFRAFGVSANPAPEKSPVPQPAIGAEAQA
ncbi:MAG TPA: heme lyase CcmF/NrfE family subunit [Dokdonella sp.]|uniref:heme lyase CcmF/NrfE family subunit n=2 Tax=Dokdonella sp. TaxID=2291710 RepID=UPI002C8F4AD7|nr:heme lyase CcmF/NrfE family subunit [Dokdonella sp.]HOX70784.1 heme lyase CcmF/NrfE family subunit [Dokdonella sp.]